MEEMEPPGASRMEVMAANAQDAVVAISRIAIAIADVCRVAITTGWRH